MAITYTSFQLRQLCQHIAKPLMRVRKTVYNNLKQLDICLATPTHRGTAAGCRRFNNAIPVRVTTTRNYIIRPSAQTVANKNNLICLSSRISEPPARTVNVDIRCINVRSVKNKATYVADLDILALTETWLGSVVDNHVIAQLVPDGYKFHTASRPAQKRGGGVAVIYKSGLKVETVSNRNKFTHFEHADYYVTARSVTFRLGVVYRPPPSKRNGFINSVFFDQWSACLDAVMLDPHDIVITGDLSFHLDIVSDPDARHFSETLADHDMTQLVTDATHSKGYLLDVVIVRNHSAIVTTRPSVYDPCLCDTRGNPSGDHMTIKFCLNARKPAPVHKEIVFWRLRHIRLPDFKRDITSLLDDMNSDAPVSDIVATYNTGLRRVVDKQALCVRRPLHCELTVRTRNS